MKRIASFIVNKRFILAGIIAAIAVVCAFLIPSVEINNDMTKYLPDDSSMKQGIDLLTQEFPDTEITQTIRVMFTGLSEEEKLPIKSRLAEIEYVDSVTYEPDDESYNSGEHTLYVINMVYDYESEEHKAIEAALDSEFSEYSVDYMDDNTAASELEPWVVALAMSLLILILFIMCGSWFEPLLFLAAIGLAIVINLGSNIVMGSISGATFTIAAILQLVLSMDYSIILMNRYRQELPLHEDKREAMKQAVASAAPSILGSGFTTVVGLLMLIFMSFKIGMDVGIVLAKGVLISMICVFAVLPMLILLFDKAIKRTEKRSPRLTMKGLSAFSFKLRRFVAIGFLVLFVASCFLKDMANTVFTTEKNGDRVAEVFTPINTITMIYDNEDSDAIEELARRLEAEAETRSAVSYPTTLAKPYDAEGMVGAIKDLSGEDVEVSLFRLLFYCRYYEGEEPVMSAGEFIDYVSELAKDDELVSSYLSADLLENIDLLDSFSDPETLTRGMTAAETADFLDMDEAEVQSLMLYYYTLYGGVDSGSMTLSDFVDFVSNELIQNPDYSAMIDQDASSQLNALSTYTDVGAMQRRRSSAEMAEFLGLDSSAAQLIYVYYFAQSSSYTPQAMTFTEFVSFVNGVSANPQFSEMMDASLAQQLSGLAVFSDPQTVTQPMDAATLSQYLGMDAEVMQQLIILYHGGDTTATSMSLQQAVDALLSSGMADATQTAQLQLLQTIIYGGINGTQYGYSELATLLGADGGSMKFLFTLHDAYNGADMGLSVQNVINFIADNSASFGSMVDSATLSSLGTARRLINTAVAGTEFSAAELAEFLGMDGQQTASLYLVRMLMQGDTDGWQLSISDFVDFIADDVLSDEAMAGQIDADAAETLVLANALIKAVVSENKLTAAEMSELLSGFSPEANSNSIGLLYVYYDSALNYDSSWQLSIEQLVDYLLYEAADDPRFELVLTEALEEELWKMEKELESGIAQMKGENFSLFVLQTTLKAESERTSEYIETLATYCDELLSGEYHLIGSSVMNYEMEGSFENEMLLIMALTAVSIFIVVAFTFKRIAVPVILVLLVQCGVFITMTASGVLSFDIYYLALLMVQCILMGATIDYGILFASYYRESRATLDIRESLKAAYKGSFHTIMTSGLIMIVVTGAIGFSPADPMIAQICLTISIGALCATLLILFVLPGLLAAFDRLVVKKPLAKKEQKPL
ncbi:MAG: MMPL family transporter [Clostridia bacterium]|nr:MMPL family transporter [Clostridia bacterium]